MNVTSYNRTGDAGRLVLVASALGLPLFTQSRTGVGRAAATLITVVGVSKLCKALIPERRPNGVDYNSFPSQHAAESFAAATLIDGIATPYVAKSAWMLAGMVSVSRVLGKKHHPRDVMAGIVLGLAAKRAGSVAPAAIKILFPVRQK